MFYIDLSDADDINMYAEQLRSGVDAVAYPGEDALVVLAHHGNNWLQSDGYKRSSSYE